MHYLTAREVAAHAYAAQYGLPDEFIDYAARNLRQRPVVALQGPSHVDVRNRDKQDKEGLCLLVCADDAGNATAMLHCKSVRRKAWLGVGFVRDPDGLPLLCVEPFMRNHWERDLVRALRHRPMMSRLRRDMEERYLTLDESRQLARAATE